MSEKYKKYKKIVNVPQKTVKRGFDAVKDWHPENNWWQLLRVPAATVAFNLYLALLLFTRIGLENPIIEKFDDLNTKKKIKTEPQTKFSRFINGIKKREKANPTLSAILVYYMLLTMLVGGGKIAADRLVFGNDSAQEQRKKDRIKIKDLKIDPTVSKEDWMRQMDAIWPYLYMETVLSEGFINEAYADVGDSGGYLTIGSGYMIGKANPKGPRDRDIIKERKAFFKKTLGKPYVNGVSISHEENRILIRRFYEVYVWPSMRQSFTRPMDAHLFIELCIGNFNRGSGIYNGKNSGANIRTAVNSGESLKQIVNKFDDLCNKGNSGLLPKYGVAAHRVLGDISDEDVLNSLANSVYKISKDKVWSGGMLREYDTIAQDLVGISNADVRKNGKTYVQHRVRDYLTDEEVQNIEQGFLFVPSVAEFTPVVEHVETTAEQLNEQGEALYVAENYRGAIEKFNAALSQDADMYIVYSNLALAYYKLGEYQSGLDVINRFMKSDKFKSAPATVKGYTYYNAALCYEKLGDNARNNKQKLEYYELAKQSAENGQNVANTKYVGFMNRIEGKISENTEQKSKQRAFNDGIKRVQQNYQQKTSVIPLDNEFQA